MYICIYFYIYIYIICPETQKRRHTHIYLDRNTERDMSCSKIIAREQQTTSQEGAPSIQKSITNCATNSAVNGIPNSKYQYKGLGDLGVQTRLIWLLSNIHQDCYPPLKCPASADLEKMPFTRPISAPDRTANPGPPDYGNCIANDVPYKIQQIYVPLPCLSSRNYASSS